MSADSRLTIPEEARPLPFIIKPRISHCALTEKWIVHHGGGHHHCGPSSSISEEAFRHWSDALSLANELGGERIERELSRRGRAAELRGGAK